MKWKSVVEQGMEKYDEQRRLSMMDKVINMCEEKEMGKCDKERNGGVINKD